MTVDKIKEIKCFILDMDGTIYLGNELFDFTKDFLNKVEENIISLQITHQRVSRHILINLVTWAFTLSQNR